MGKGGQSRQVPDYLMSLDYGFCHGPVDSLNMVWVKDKPILCGRYETRTDVEIVLPELFGGDDAEGGVRGVLEFYTGSDDQHVSTELAVRSNRNPTTAPGYRGTTHLFFRGLRDWTAVEADESPYSAIVNAVARVFSAATTFARPSTRLGWVWGSNNPYAPPVKANFTRLPGSDEYREIWPLGAVYNQSSVDSGDGTGDIPIRNDAQAPDLTLPGLIVDAFAHGADQPTIDAGAVTLRIEWGANFRAWEGAGSGTGTARTAVRFYDEVPTAWDAAGIDPVSGEEALVAVEETIVLPREGRDGWFGAVEHGIDEVTLPVGCRYFQVMASFDQGQTYVVPGSTAGTFTLAIDETLPVPVDPEEQDLYSAPPEDFRLVAKDYVGVYGLSPFRIGTVVDLYSLGVTQEEIDNGLVRVALYARGEFTGSLPVLEPLDETVIVGQARFHATEPTDYNTDAPLFQPHGFEPGPVVTTEFEVSPLLGSIEVDCFQPYPGTRYIDFNMAYPATVGNSYSVQFGQWQVLKAGIGSPWCLPDGTLGPQPDANPAHIIYECMTNPDWGKGEDPALIDTDSYTAAAETLFNERMGMSLGWYQQSEIETLIGDILDHIRAFHYQDPASGLWTLKLLRDDYNVEELETLDETNCVATNRKRRLWGETINEVVVTYTDPKTEKEATVSAHNLANIAIQGSVSSETRDYHGFRNPFIAQVVANRDVAEAGYPLFSTRVEVDRSEWLARPGAVRKFSWPEDGIEQIVMRVMSVDYGAPKDRKITLELTEDIFGIDQAQYSAPQTSQWESPVVTPSALVAAMAMTLPLPPILRSGATVSDVDDAYPDAIATILADAEGDRPTTVAISASTTAANGDTGYQEIGYTSVTLSGLISLPLAAEAESRVSDAMVGGVTRLGGQPGDFFVLGESEAESELIMLDSYDAENGEWVVARGMWDTVPVAWPAGSRFWMFKAANRDPVRRSAGETVAYSLVPVTGQGYDTHGQPLLTEATFTERAHAPFRPANAQLAEMGFEDLIQREEPYPTEIEATWNTRNRTTEDTVAVRWSEDDATPEVGQTTVLRILDSEGELHLEVTGLTGNSHTIDIADLPPTLAGSVEFLSERGGIRSVFGARRNFDIRPPAGYGAAYGIGYGGDQDA